MLSEQGQALLLKRSYKHEYQEELVTRPRLSSDDIRVLFRSMVVSQLKDASEIDNHQRNEDDDRDLLDVMNSIMTRKMSQTQTKWCYGRKELLAVGNTLPSSFSQATEGSLRREELCALLDLLKALEPLKNSADTNRDPDTVPYWRYVCGCVDEGGCVDEEWGSWIVDRGANVASNHSLDYLVNTLQRPETQPKPISWESSHCLLQKTYVRSPPTDLQCTLKLTLWSSSPSWNSYATSLNTHSTNSNRQSNFRRTFNDLCIAGARGTSS